MFKFKPFYDLALMFWDNTIVVYEWFFTEIYIPEFEIFGNSFGGFDIAPVQIMLGAGLVFFLVYTLIKYFVR